jgi:hypothetical protein
MKELITFDKYDIPGDREPFMLYANNPGLEIIFLFPQTKLVLQSNHFWSLPNKNTALSVIACEIG